MKILIQHVHTKLYFNLLGVWTANSNYAHDFRHSDHAFEFVNKNELADVQLVVKFDDASWEEVIPVPLRVASLSTQISATA